MKKQTPCIRGQDLHNRLYGGFIACSTYDNTPFLFQAKLVATWECFLDAVFLLFASFLGFLLVLFFE